MTRGSGKQWALAGGLVLWGLAGVQLAQAQVAGTYVGQTETGATVLVQVDADGDGLTWSWSEVAYTAACPDGSQRPADFFFPVFEPVTGGKLHTALRADFFAEDMSLRFDPDGVTVHGRVNAEVPMFKGRTRSEVCVLPPQNYTATLQAAGARYVAAPVFKDRQRPVPAALVAAGTPAAVQTAITTTYNGSTSQGYPITIEWSVDEHGTPVQQFFFYPTGWDLSCLSGGAKAGGGAFYAHREVDGDRIRFSSDDDQRHLRGAMRVSDGGTMLAGQFELDLALFADVEHSQRKATTCFTGAVSFQANAALRQPAR